ncbi:hypothetical protein TrLO_g6548 [Triparma laevis f. longispina]|uniref:Uncharacterized protein n=1 Tax=Triparma laevis f. longispina TaxID=1714387 RepID=A0A9W7A486_9STRA|nr:hypothetical protein TrLO_g6548 [Triparma laevis f. longispina]
MNMVLQCQNCYRNFEHSFAGTEEELNDPAYLKRIREENQYCSKSCTWAKFVKDHPYELTATAMCAGLAPVGIAAAGFTASGVAAGSIAAGVQSTVYGAWTTGLFSVMQSAGTGSVMVVPVMGAAGTAGAVVTNAIRRLQGTNDETDEEDNETDEEDI